MKDNMYILFLLLILRPRLVNCCKPSVKIEPTNWNWYIDTKPPNSEELRPSTVRGYCPPVEHCSCDWKEILPELEVKAFTEVWQPKPVVCYYGSRLWKIEALFWCGVNNIYKAKKKLIGNSRVKRIPPSVFHLLYATLHWKKIRTVNYI